MDEADVVELFEPDTVIAKVREFDLVHGAVFDFQGDQSFNELQSHRLSKFQTRKMTTVLVPIKAEDTIQKLCFEALHYRIKKS